MTSAFCFPGQITIHVLHSRRRRAPLLAPQNAAQVSMKDTNISSVASSAAMRGFQLKDDSLGPLLNMSLYRTGGDGAYVGSISGAVLPNGRLHIEAYKAAPRDRRGALLDVSPGMILFIAALAFGRQKGAKHVYGLAINDSPDQHRRLVRYLKRFGGAEEGKVTESLRDVPTRMFYGGLGTIIRGDVDQMLARGEGMLERTTPVVPRL